MAKKVASEIDTAIGTFIASSRMNTLMRMSATVSINAVPVEAVSSATPADVVCRRSRKCFNQILNGVQDHEEARDGNAR